MSNSSNEREKYDLAFIESLSIDPTQLGDNITFNQTQAWDSIGHMTLIAALESAFGITLDVDDITSLSSYGKGIEILTKYGINLDKKAA